MMLVVDPPANGGTRAIAYCQSACFQFWNTCTGLGEDLTMPACFGNVKRYRPECTIAASIHANACGTYNPDQSLAIYHGVQFCFERNPEYEMQTLCKSGLQGSCLNMGKTSAQGNGALDQNQLATLSGSKCPDPVGCAATPFQQTPPPTASST